MHESNHWLIFINYSKKVNRGCFSHLWLSFDGTQLKKDILYFLRNLWGWDLDKTAFKTPFISAKKPARHATFLARCLVYPCRDYFRAVVSALPKFWALVPHYIWDRYVYTSKIGSAVPQNRQNRRFLSPCKWGLILTLILQILYKPLESPSQFSPPFRGLQMNK